MADASPRDPVSAVGYIRVSTAREEMISPQIQRAGIEAKAQRDGVPVAEWIEELDISGRGFGRKGVQQAIERIESGARQIIYVYKYSRFGRNATLTGVAAMRVEEAAGRLISATEEVDARTAVGKLTRGMLWQLDEFYSNLIGEQWQEAHAKRRRDGLPHHGQPRFGYVYHRAGTESRPCPQGCKPGACVTGYVPDAETGRDAAWMYQAYVSGMSVLKIAVDLNGRGLRAPGRGAYADGGHLWDQRSVRRYMDSGFAAGLLRVHDPVCGCGNAQGCARKVHQPGAHEPLIDADVWEAYLRQRAARRRLPPRVEQPVYPLAGLVFCGACGGPMSAHGGLTKSGYRRGYLYQCAAYKKARACAGTWITRHRVEAAVLAWLRTVASDVDEAAKVERGRVRARKASAGASRRLAAEVTRYENALTRLTVQLAQELVPPGAYAAARDDLAERRDAARAALERVAADDDRMPGAPVRVAAGLLRDWPTLPPASQRAVLGHLVARCEVTSKGGHHMAEVKVVTTWGETYLYDA